MQVTPEDVLEAVAKSTRFTFRQTADGFEFDSENRSGWDVLTVSADDLARIVETVNSYSALDETAVALASSAEMLVRTVGFYSQSSLAGISSREEDLVVSNQSEGLSYSFGRPSDSYLAYLLLKITARDSLARGFDWRFFGELGRTRRDRGGAADLFEVLRSRVRVRVLRMESSGPVAPGKWGTHADDFFFHIGYSLNVALTRQRYLDNLLRPARISGMRRSRLDLDAPKRTYISDLVYHYQLGLAAESPMLEYISYYHVMEHWFETIYHQSLVKRVQSEITDPSFSYKKTKDIQRLIRIITKAVQAKGDEITFNEQAALKLTLEQYLQIDRLVDELTQFNSSLLDYYTSNEVSFCSADRVNLRGSNSTEVIAALSRRIYKTRNALVHSKDGLKARYVPFSHDEELLSEIPLARFVAEQIIISTSELRR
ncbi:hypothetical protein [Nocardia terpenica]|uniref:Uncharacterized protein n=1 Tax=Nocardia terpenica TaxID=455432 RepID=A0A6G9YZB6_9NOCA|nr:hypothetical protein [Nocardia terpenica]QIS18520.1 hypothetical protein F6W96_09700 [Nocardia terpenica]